MKQILVILFSVIVIIILNLSCGSTEPEKTKFKHPRDMTWTADTLMPDPEAIQLLPENILVFAPDDIWLVCYSDVAKRLLWHYDGNKWSPVESGGGKRYRDIAGYNKYDIWLGGYSGEKAHFTHKNGNNFIRNDFDITGQILDMTMDPQGNIWACGRNGIIMKYDKTKWIADTLKMNFKVNTQFFLKGIAYYDNKIFSIISTVDNNTLIEKYFYASGTIKNWVVADSMVFDSQSSIRKWGYRELYSSGWNRLYSNGLGGVWKYNNKTWENILNVSGAINAVFGAGDNYFFSVGDFSKSYFYDGTSWENINYLFKHNEDDIIFETGWTNGMETFIICRSFKDFPDRTIILHGK
jgi:hypothetical protein